jgi:hypothetical protein
MKKVRGEKERKNLIRYTVVTYRDITQGKRGLLYHTYQPNISFVYRIINMHKKKERKQKKIKSGGNIIHQCINSYV